MFGPSRVFPGTMTSANSMQFVVTTRLFFRIHLLDAPARPPRVLTHSFPLHLPYLPPTIPCSYWTLTCVGVSSSSAALYMVSVRQARVFPPSFFRSRLTVDSGLSPFRTCAHRARHIKKLPQNCGSLFKVYVDSCLLIVTR